MANENAVKVDIEKIIRNVRQNMAVATPTKEPFSIFRVPEHIRCYKKNKFYFEPRVVAIGPYHRDKEHLRAMEMHKWRYLSTFLRNDEATWKKCVDEIAKHVTSIRKCYFESIEDLSDDELVEMLLLDGCFILQLMIKLYDQKNTHDCIIDPVFGVNWNLPLISTDLLMLENQIPFSVLDNLYKFYSRAESSQTPKPSLDDLILNFVKRVEPRRKLEVEINFKKWFVHKIENSEGHDQIHHLLHFYYIANIPVSESTNSPKSTSFIYRALSYLSLTSRLQKETRCSEEARLPDETHPSEDSGHSTGNTSYPRFPPSKEQMKEEIHLLEARRLEEFESSKDTSYPRMIPCATELQEFGITFKKHEQPKNFLDISFKRGVLKIPCISIEETTKPKYMNLVAFEQSIGMENKHMTSYAIFMDFLLNTGKDVIILQRDNIIENKLTNEDEVAEFFSQFQRCCYIKFDEHYLAPVFRDIKVYCEKIWPRHRARLCHDYFSNPWAIFSLGAALLVLSITIFRTVCFVLSAFFYYHNLS